MSKNGRKCMKNGQKQKKRTKTYENERNGRNVKRRTKTYESVKTRLKTDESV